MWCRYYPSYLGDGNRRIQSLRAVWAKLVRPSLKNKRARGTVQGVEHLHEILSLMTSTTHKN
jgi:hypothetical protein